MRRLLRSALLFIAIGLAIHAGLWVAAERLLVRTGHSHPLFRIATAPVADFDWVVLGASHAMPLAFADFNATMERDTGLRIVNLASPGTGPLYNRFVLEQFLHRHRARHVLYVVDAFAFHSRSWNEERFADPKLLARTPFEPEVASALWRYAREEGVDARAVLDYTSGFSKINNRERFRRDAWEGEAQFDRVARASATAAAKRIAYLYPDGTPPAALAKYLQTFASLLALAQREGMDVTVVKLPLPPAFQSRLPAEAAFDAALAGVLAAYAVPLHDFSGVLPQPQYYFDTDHLNRAGATMFFDRWLRDVLMTGHPDEAPSAK